MPILLSPWPVGFTSRLHYTILWNNHSRLGCSQNIVFGHFRSLEYITMCDNVPGTNKTSLNEKKRIFVYKCSKIHHYHHHHLNFEPGLCGSKLLKKSVAYKKLQYSISKTCFVFIHASARNRFLLNSHIGTIVS